MSRISLSGDVSGTGTITIAAPNTNTSRTLILPDATGTLLATTSPVIQPRGTPLFSAFQSVAQSVTTSSTKVNFQSEEVDTEGWYDTTLSRYTPQTAGWYHFTASVQVLNVVASVFVAFYKNNGISKYGTNVANVAGNGIASAIIYLNGSTDYVEVFATIGTAQNLLALNYTTYFQGYLVRAD